jgi:hypothetical protein
MAGILQSIELDVFEQAARRVCVVRVVTARSMFLKRKRPVAV